MATSSIPSSEPMSWQIYKTADSNGPYLIFLDMETSGLSAQRSHILEVAFKVVDSITGELFASFSSVVKLPEEEFQIWEPISHEWESQNYDSFRLNGFTWNKMAEGAPPSDVASRICILFQEVGINKENAQFYCENPSSDRPFFEQLVPLEYYEEAQLPYHWFDLASVDHARQMEQLRHMNVRPPERMLFSKDAVAARYDLPPEERPHSAMSGVDHLIECYRKVVGFPLSEEAIRAKEAGRESLVEEKRGLFRRRTGYSL